MSRLNTARAISRPKTHEGAPAKIINPEQQLRRSVLSCLLWEDSFYEDGQSIADRIVAAAQNVPASKLAALAIEARTKYNLRHVPLTLLSVLCRTGAGTSLVSDTFAQVINRADELTEFVAIHAALNGVSPDKVKPVLSAQAKKGLAKAFKKFDAYALAKYNRDGAVKLRDVLFLAHPKPADDDQARVWKLLVEGKLPSPDTWEVELSAGGDKNAVFTRLLQEKKLGYFALLRNLRNMVQAGVNTTLILDALRERKGGADKILPFRYIAAARAVPQLEPALDEAMQFSIDALPRLSGKTAVLVDVSGSMNDKLSAKSDMTRMDAAAALASIIRSDSLRVFTFSDALVEVAPRRGMAGVDAVRSSQPHGGTELGGALARLNREDYDRIIVITDEQSHDRVGDPRQGAKGYMINVANYQHGVGYGRWIHIDGFSENVIRFIHELENQR